MYVKKIIFILLITLMISGCGKNTDDKVENVTSTPDKNNVVTENNPTIDEKEPVITEVSGSGHFAALSEDGDVWMWGEYGMYQLADGAKPETGQRQTIKSEPVKLQSIKKVKKIFCGGSATYAIKRDGTVWAWGHNEKGAFGDGKDVTVKRPFRIEGLENIKQISAFMTPVLYLNENGTVKVSGNTYPEITQIDGLTNVVKVSTGAGHFMILKSDGTVWTWGSNFFGQLGDGTNTERHISSMVKVLDNAIDIEAGLSNSFAIKEDKTVWAWGHNRHGELGNDEYGYEVSHNKPFMIEGLSDAKSISAQGSYTLVLKEDGTVWSFGDNYFGSLGDGTYESRSTPEKIESLSNVKQISAGTLALALKEDGTVWYWGDEGALKSNVPVKMEF